MYRLQSKIRKIKQKMSKDVFWKSLVLKVKNSFNLFTVNIYEVDQIAQFLRVCYLLSQLWVAKKYKPNKNDQFFNPFFHSMETNICRDTYWGCAESDVAVVAADGTYVVQSAAILNAFVTLSHLLLMSLLWMLLLRMMFIVHMGTI